MCRLVTQISASVAALVWLAQVRLRLRQWVGPLHGRSKCCAALLPVGYMEHSTEVRAGVAWRGVLGRPVRLVVA